MIYRFREFYIPTRMMPALRRWIDHGILPGNFLQAVLRNDLRRAVALADDENLANLPAYTSYLYNDAPQACWGSPERVEAWSKKFEASPRDRRRRTDGTQDSR